MKNLLFFNGVNIVSTMENQTALLLLIIIILLVWYLVSNKMIPGTESYRSCRDCDGNVIAKNGTTVLNPFVWPYSGTQCVDDLYILNQDTGIDIGSDVPMSHRNTPDHVILT
jgi:hypothetical protein